MPNKKETEGLTFNSEEGFVYLFMNMDDLHLSDFREMRLKSKVDFDIAYFAVIRANNWWLHGHQLGV